MLLGNNQNETMFFYLMYGDFKFKIGLQILYENDLKKLNHEDKKRAEEFMRLLNNKRIWKIAEFYNDMVFRLPMLKQAEYHSDNGGNTYV